jgi:23S rRNA U2552 (ribose-2'-O)-methylase RlmE/FtsJ/DNA-directed RNA polymerase subunit E'/Rpb7
MDDKKFKYNKMTTVIELEPYQIHSDLHIEIYNKLKKLYECKCDPTIGYIKKDSIRITKKSEGYLRPNAFTGSFLFEVEFGCLSVKPIPDDTFFAIVNKKNTAGLHARSFSLPFDFYILTDFHKDDEEILKLMDSIEEKSTIEVRILKAELQKSIKNKTGGMYQIIAKLVRIDSSFRKDFQLVSESSNLDLTTIDLIISKYAEIKYYASTKYITKLKSIKEQIGNIKNNDIAQQVNLAEGNKLLSNNFTPGDSNGKHFWDLSSNIVYEYSLLEDNYYYDFNTCLISRAFYKMIEILNSFDLLFDDKMNILNLAESPGGFIQALLYMRKLHSMVEDEYFVFSITEMGKTELWDRKKSVITKTKAHPEIFGNVVFNNDPKKTNSNTTVHLIDEEYGDLLKDSTHEYIASNLPKRKMHLVTADGAFGLDETEDDYQNQEIRHYRLFISEIILALSTNAEGGHFILKVFDIMTETMIKLLNILNQCYNIVRIFKPVTSKQSNSEKYIICMNFILDEQTNKIIFMLKELLHLYEINSYSFSADEYLNPYLDLDLSEEFVNNIKLYNDMFLKSEHDTISQSINVANEMINILEVSHFDYKDVNKYIKQKNKVKETSLKLFTKSNNLPDINYKVSKGPVEKEDSEEEEVEVILG